MPTSSNSNLNSTPDIEDIFSESDAASAQPELTGDTLPSPLLEPLPEELSVAQPQAEPVVLPTSESTDSVTVAVENEPTTRVSALGRRRWLMIGIVAGGLLLLGGVGAFVWYWVQLPPALDDNTNATNTNVDSVININQPPLNIEINTTITNQDNTNTNIADVFIDSDHDGLSDQEELISNTNPKKKDTDDDGLSDREEVRVYLTDPRDLDTDDDGYVDGVEVANFYHPNDPDPKKRLFDLPN